MELHSNFNKAPYVQVKGRENNLREGWKAIGNALSQKLAACAKQQAVIVVETYQGVLLNALAEKLKDVLQPALFLHTAEALRDEEAIRELIQPDVTDDRIFGYMSRLHMKDFMDSQRLAKMQETIRKSKAGPVVVFGYGASLVWETPDVFIYADMARWEIQRRMRENLVNNLGINNKKEHPELKYKRGFFVDWRVCDRLKKQTQHQWDFVLDTSDKTTPKMVDAAAFMEGLKQAAHRPFSLVPFFDAGPWGGQWMKQKFDLDTDSLNFAWCFNCVPEENSLYLKFGETLFETPSINLVFFQSVELLGPAVYGRFGDEFPIRFDFLDTMDGGNLSLQVHPLTGYIQDHFGMHYTQDESYYLMDAQPDGSVYLGLKEEVNRAEMEQELRTAQQEGKPFDPTRYVENWPAQKHDHFLIPAGTIHCSGKNSMVLEISATPYIFTFKLYDWGRKNLDGKPRPINLNHGLKNIQWKRTTSWTKANLTPRADTIAEGDGWREEQTGLHELEFIETRRHWFTKKVQHHTNGGVNVLNLVEGAEAIVESPGNAFAPFVVHYAETFIVPATAGAYTIRPYGTAEGSQCATIKAFVRTRAC